MKIDEIGMVADMAFRNLTRHRVKTIITTSAIAVSVAIYIFVDAWLLGMNIESRRNIIVYEMGAAKIQSPAYFSRKDDLPMYESFSEWQELSSALEKSGYRSAPRFVFTGTMYSRTGSAPLVINAVDVAREKELFRYPDYIDAGSFPAEGTRGIAIGTFAAEKLHVGIPQRPDGDELENELVAAASGDGERAFIRSLYVPYRSVKEKKRLFTVEEDSALADNRYILRSDISESDMRRFWNILAGAGRMDVRISTTIDIKALPERIAGEKFTHDVLPLFSGDDRAALSAAYTKDPLLGDYILTGTDEKSNARVLALLLEADYSGAVRHVNQLIDAVITGVVNSPNPKTNGNIAFIPIDSLQDETGLLLDGRVTELLIRSAKAKDSQLPGKFESVESILSALSKSSCAPRFSGSAGTTVPELSIFSWQSYSADYFAAAAGDNISTRVMILFLFILSFIGIANTMLMAILERTKEIGMLRALGMTDAQLLLSYMIEASLVGVIGSTIGVIVGCLINIPMVNYGIDYSAVTEAMDGNIGYRISSSFKSMWNAGTIVATFFAASLLSGCMAVVPTLRALKMPVTETLRFE